MLDKAIQLARRRAYQEFAARGLRFPRHSANGAGFSGHPEPAEYARAAVQGFEDELEKRASIAWDILESTMDKVGVDYSDSLEQTLKSEMTRLMDEQTARLDSDLWAHLHSLRLRGVQPGKHQLIAAYHRAIDRIEAEIGIYVLSKVKPKTAGVTNMPVTSPDASISESTSQRFSKHGDYIPQQTSFLPGEFVAALRSIVEALTPKPDSFRLFVSITLPDGTSCQKHGADYPDLNPIVHPGRDLRYMELSFENAKAGAYSLTGSFYGLAWWLGLNANGSEQLTRFWNLLSDKFGLQDAGLFGDPSRQKRLNSRASTANDSRETCRVIHLVKSKLRAAMRKQPTDEKAVQDILEVVLLGADVKFSRETETIEYSSRTYRPDFTLSGIDLVVEVKFCADATREKAIIQEINDDIMAYRTKFTNLLFIVYDVGWIRDVAKFRGPFELQDGVDVYVIKH